MKILLTGVTGYIGKRLLPFLLENNHEVVCLVRDPRRLHDKFAHQSNVSLIKADLLNRESLSQIPQDIDIAFYFAHSMGSANLDFFEFRN